MKNLFYLFFIIIIFPSCQHLNPSKMFMTNKTYKYIAPIINDTSEYRIGIYDELSILFLTNNGENLVNPFESDNKINEYSRTVYYKVNKNGKVKLPVIDEVYIEGYTENEAEKLMESLYSKYYNQSYIMVSVRNKHVTIFTGGETGSGKIIPLLHDKTNLIEVLAAAGGINDGKAKKIKIIRGNLSNPQIYSIDLSKLSSMVQSNLYLKPNDIVYVEPRNRYSQKILTELVPYLSVITTFIVVYSFIKK